MVSSVVLTSNSSLKAIIAGREWTGIPCRREANGALTVVADNEIARLVAAWLAAGHQPEAFTPPEPGADDVNRERDRRIAVGFSFGGKVIQSDDASKIKINGAAQLAFMAVVAGGGAPGNLRWHGGATDFGWITMDNSILTLDAPTMIDMGKAAAAWEQAHIFAARALKSAEPIPADYASDSHWPPVA